MQDDGKIKTGKTLCGAFPVEWILKFQELFIFFFFSVFFANLHPADLTADGFG